MLIGFKQFLNINGRVEIPYHFSCLYKIYCNMIFVSYTKTDTYYEFVGENGEKVIAPATDVIIVDDESGMKAVKLIASRRLLGLLRG